MQSFKMIKIILALILLTLLMNFEPQKIYNEASQHGSKDSVNEFRPN